MVLVSQRAVVTREGGPHVFEIVSGSSSCRHIVAMPVGQGHASFTRFASKRGVNPIEVLAPITEAETGALAWAATRVKIARAGDADGSLIMFAGEMREHPHEHETR